MLAQTRIYLSIQTKKLTQGNEVNQNCGMWLRFHITNAKFFRLTSHTPKILHYTYYPYTSSTLFGKKKLSAREMWGSVFSSVKWIFPPNFLSSKLSGTYTHPIAV